MTITTISAICALKRPRHIQEWMLWEHWNHGSVEVETVGGITRWRNVHGYRATGASEPAKDES